MKNKKYLILIILAISTHSEIIFCQSSTSNILIPIPGTNLPGTGNDFIGWANGTLAGALLAIPELTVKNEENMPINFYTNTIGSATIPRMTIYEDPTNSGAFNAGYAAIGWPTPPRHLTIVTLNKYNVGTGYTFLPGDPPSMVELLVAGGNAQNDTVQEVAEFRSTNVNILKQLRFAKAKLISFSYTVVIIVWIFQNLIYFGIITVLEYVFAAHGHLIEMLIVHT